MQLAILVQQSLTISETSHIAIASAAVGFVAAIALGVLSILEHRNTSRPSFIISIYVLLSMLFDIVRTRTAWLGNETRALAATTTVAVALKLAILALETVNKRSILLETYHKLSKEATSGFLSRSLFLWLASLLMQGSKKALTLKDLFGIHEKLDPHKLTQELSKQWKKSKNAPKVATTIHLTTLGNRRRRYGLAMATLWAWKTELAKIAIPRLIIVALNISQPFIIGAIIDNTLAHNTPEIRNQGHGLIGAVALSYFGIAVCFHSSKPSKIY